MHLSSFTVLTLLILYAICFVIAAVLAAGYCEQDGGDKWYQPGGVIVCLGAGILSPVFVAAAAIIALLILCNETLGRWRQRSNPST